MQTRAAAAAAFDPRNCYSAVSLFHELISGLDSYFVTTQLHPPQASGQFLNKSFTTPLAGMTTSSRPVRLAAGGNRHHHGKCYSYYAVSFHRYAPYHGWF